MEYAAGLKAPEKKSVSPTTQSGQATEPPTIDVAAAQFGVPLFLSTTGSGCNGEDTPLRLSNGLAISQQNDGYEQEADRVANAVTYGKIATQRPVFLTLHGSQSTIRNTVQRCACGDIAGKTGECDACRQRRLTVQRKAQNGSTIHTPTNLIPSGGQPMSAGLRAYFEPRYGQELSDVRIHTGSQATNAASAVGAYAFTVGNHIVFNQDQFKPESTVGRWMLAHELTHVVQQNGGGQVQQTSITPLAAGAKAQRIGIPSWNDVGNTLASGAHVVGQTVGAGAAWVGDRAESAVEAGAEIFMSTIELVSPGLARLIREGPGGLIGEALDGGIRSWLGGLLGGIDLGAAVTGLVEGFATGYKVLQGVLQGTPEACAMVASALDSLRQFGQELADNPAIQAIKGVWEKIKGVFKTVTDFVLAPVFDTLISVAGTVFNGVKQLASTIWGWGGAVRRKLAAAWNWAMERLGIGGDSEGGLLNWLKTKATTVWDSIKETLAPVIGPLKKVGMVLLAFSPIGPFLLAVRYLPQLIKMAQWLWQHRSDPDIIRSARTQMSNTILPQVLESVQGFGNGIRVAAQSLLQGLGKIGQALIQTVSTITGVPLLSILQSVFDSVSAGVNQLIEWVSGAVQGAADTITQLFGRISAIVRPYMGVLTSIGLAIVNPGMIPVILAGWAWQALPDCYKAPIIDFLLDIVIGFLEALPMLPMLGPLWPLLKSGIIGFLQGVRRQDPATKIFISNKLARIISGGSPAFILGFVKGLLKGLWEGLTDPFVLAYQAISALSDLIVWLGDMANQALSPQPVPAQSAPPAAASATTSASITAAQPTTGSIQQARPAGGGSASITAARPATGSIQQARPAGGAASTTNGQPGAASIRRVQPAGSASTVSASGQPAPATAQAAERAPAVAGEAQSSEQIPPAQRAVVGQRMQAMGGELQPPVQEVAGNFMAAVQEALSSGGNTSFDDLMQKLGEAWSAIDAAIRGSANQMVDSVVGFMMQDSAEGEMGETVGWLTGTIAFEVILAFITAGAWEAASGAMKVLKVIAKILDWTGEVLGVAFKAVAKVGGFILDGLKGLRKLFSRAGGAAGTVLKALGEIGEKLVHYAGELLGLVRRGGAEAVETAAARGAREAVEVGAEHTAREAVETAAERSARETAEAISERGAREGAEGATERGTREAVETAQERTARETAEQGSERGAREGAEDSAERGSRESAAKAAEFPEAVAAARSIEATYDALNAPVALLLINLNALKRRFHWIKRFEARPNGPLGRYSIHMIASDTEIDDYSEQSSLDPADSAAQPAGAGAATDPGGRGRYGLSDAEIGRLPASDADRLRVLQSRLPSSEAELAELVTLRQRASGGALPELPGTPEHMLDSWRQYLNSPRERLQSFQRWTAGHPSRMRNSVVGPAAEAGYREALEKGGVKSRSAVLETASRKRRQVDVLIEHGPGEGRDLIQIKAGSEWLGTKSRRSGGASLGSSSHSNTSALAADAEFIASSDRVPRDRVTWVFEQRPSVPLVAQARTQGVDVIIRVDDAVGRARMVELMGRSGMSEAEIASVKFVEGTTDDVVNFVASRFGAK